MIAKVVLWIFELLCIISLLKLLLNIKVKSGLSIKQHRNKKIEKITNIFIQLVFAILLGIALYSLR